MFLSSYQSSPDFTSSLHAEVHGKKIFFLAASYCGGESLLALSVFGYPSEWCPMACSCLTVAMFPDFSEILAFLELYLGVAHARVSSSGFFSALTPVIWTYLSPAVVMWLCPAYVTNPVVLFFSHDELDGLTYVFLPPLPPFPALIPSSVFAFPWRCFCCLIIPFWTLGPVSPAFWAISCRVRTCFR